MGILMTALSPHPPMIIPDIGGKERNKIRKTIESMKELAGEIRKKEPDLLITISPHGPVFTDAISILDQPYLEGDFSDFGFSELKYQVKTEPGFVKRLKERADQASIEVISLSSGKLENFNFRARLDHGVLVPLYFLKEAGVECPVIPITMGLLSYENLYEFGLIIQKTLAEMDIQAVIIASGDLSHRLKPGAPAGFNPRGQEFDEELVGLLNKEEYCEVLELDHQLIEKAGECGLRPLTIMLGSMHGLNFSSDVKSYEGPFGVGYAVIGFYPGGENQDEE